jgi:hypothetical protein
MSMERTPAELVARGAFAAEVLGSEVLEDAFERAKAEFSKEWLSTTDPQRQQAAWAKTHGLDAIRRELRRIVGEGEYARAVLRQNAMG